MLGSFVDEWVDMWIEVFLSLLTVITVYVRGAYDKFRDFFRMGTFIDSKHMKL